MSLTGSVHELDEVRDHAPGWRTLLDELRVALEALPVEVRVTQCREKFGGLRLHYDLPEDASDLLAFVVDDLVGDAENASLRVCFTCGAPRTHRGVGFWTRYFCDEHDTADVHEERRGDAP